MMQHYLHVFNPYHEAKIRAVEFLRTIARDDSIAMPTQWNIKPDGMRDTRAMTSLNYKHIAITLVAYADKPDVLVITYPHNWGDDWTYDPETAFTPEQFEQRLSHEKG